MQDSRNTRQRKTILKAVKERCDHPNAHQIYLDVSKIDKKISLGTVYRNLNVLVSKNEILQIKVSDGDRYDNRIEFHYHFLCSNCKKIYDAPIPYDKDFDAKIQNKTDFIVNRHCIIIEGICHDCQNN